MRAYLLPVDFATCSVNAQTTFAPVGAQWTYRQGLWSGPDSNLAVFQATADTVVQGKTCTAITATGWFSCHDHVRILHLSNDSMFYYNDDTESFVLLFRWNASPGDTWATPLGGSVPFDTLDWTVLDTAHVLIAGMDLRRLTVTAQVRNWSLETTMGGEVLERLGGPGPFAWKPAVCDGETFGSLRCYEDSAISWMDPQITQCALGTTVVERDQRPVLLVSPSLVRMRQPISISTSDASLLSVEVVDAMGSIVHRPMLTNGRAEVRLEVPGSYTIRSVLSGVRASQRVVVQ